MRSGNVGELHQDSVIGIAAEFYWVFQHADCSSLQKN
jgi:hypothetical protein